jgi:hypothetical protein
VSTAPASQKSPVFENRPLYAADPKFKFQQPARALWRLKERSPHLMLSLKYSAAMPGRVDAKRSRVFSCSENSVGRLKVRFAPSN